KSDCHSFISPSLRKSNKTIEALLCLACAVAAWVKAARMSSRRTLFSTIIPEVFARGERHINRGQRLIKAAIILFKGLGILGIGSFRINHIEARATKLSS